MSIDEAALCRPIPRRFPVLVVDDDGTMRETLSICLHEEGFEVSSAASGEAALRLLARTPQRWIVISDLHLGAGMNGLELREEIARWFPRHGFVLISGECAEPDSPALISKPFRLATLVAKLDAIALADPGPAPPESFVPEGA